MNGQHLVAIVAIFSLSPAHALSIQSSLRDQIRELVLAQYRAVERGDLDAWASAFAEDAFLF